MFVRVIPLLRTPLGVEAFDYSVPEHFTPTTGDIVLIPFRRKIIPGLVSELLTKSAFVERIQPVHGSYGGLKFPPNFLEFLRFTAQRTFCSQPTVLLAFLRKLPKRPVELAPLVFQKPLEHLHRTLILTPWKHRAERLAKERGALFLTGDLSDGEAALTWRKFLAERNSTLVATRLGAWLSPFCDIVEIDEPAADDHKQDDLTPRYDARTLAAWAENHTGTRVVAAGVTPPLDSKDEAVRSPAELRDEAPDIHVDLTVLPRTRAGFSNIPMIEASSLEILREHNGPIIVIHPIKGEAARFTCRDCGWSAPCAHCGFSLSATGAGAVCRRCGSKSAPPLLCSKCGGADLGKTMPGIERLKRAAAMHEAELSIEWRGVSPAELDAPLPHGAALLVTDGELLAVGGAEDIRRRERTVIAFRLLSDAVARSQGRLIVQTVETNLENWKKWITSKGFAEFRFAELAERKLFGYPPAVRLVKVIVPTERAAVWGSKAEESLADIATLRGPFQIPYRVKSRASRSIWHILPNIGAQEDLLIEKLRPLAGEGVIIDLDPITFFR